MLSIARFAMKGPNYALIAVILFSILSVFLAPFGILVGAITGLVTLRVSISEGFKALAFGVVTHLVLTLVVSGSYFPAVVAILEYMLPVWLMAIVLRQTNSLALALQFAMLLLGLATIAFHLMVNDPAQFWMAQFTTYVQPMLESSEIAFEPQAMQDLAQMVTMLIGVFMLVLWFSILIIARWWQSELYYPGRFKESFYALALPKSTAYTAVALAVLGLVMGAKPSVIYDLSGIIIAGLMFQGLAIAHQTVAIRELSSAWLVGLYVLLFVLPQTMLILATIGLVDSWIDFRNRWEKE